ncbi:tRNA lysidine(34) synthetase TilS [Treponema zioleckii]|uniref:tRNA lysidine(34) synthetase TilS n=1 Tax=Treponema zioleckii TaxID=331680 RepID=UPI00168AF425|nr:tRNA lysidine(34) synthetase TilS [Treponema zioleckii]
MDVFEQKISDFFEKNNIHESEFGIAVSGGADSVSMMIALKNIFGAEKIKVINVNHNLREESETKADSDYVEHLCAKIGVSCSVVTFARGKIENLAKSRGRGIEEAARFARYEAFEKFRLKNHLKYICLAHNQNDNLETALMRFLQGSGLEGGGGIAPVRGCFLRPLSEVSRAEIESYLTEKKIEWCTDSTNNDVNFLRNKIRHVLFPVLDENFAGWKKALSAGIEKNIFDESFFDRQVDKLKWDENPSDCDSLLIERKIFMNLDFAIQRRLVYKAFSILKCGERFPYKVLKTIDSWRDAKNHEVCANDVVLRADGKSFFVERKKDKLPEFDFLCVVRRECEFTLGKSFFCFENGTLFLENQSEESSEKKSVCKLCLPFCVRTAQFCDKILMKNGVEKSIFDIFSDWHVREEDKKSLFVVQSLTGRQKIVALVGENSGYKNWVLRENSAENR